jgi:hypothetical protein
MEVYIGYNKEDFFYNLIKNNNTNNNNNILLDNSYSKNIRSDISNSNINPTDNECRILLDASWGDASCTYFFSDNSTNCIKKEICKNKDKINNLENLDTNHKPKYERNLELDEEFKNTILDTVNLSLGIIFIIIAIFKLTSMVKKQT